MTTHDPSTLSSRRLWYGLAAPSIAWLTQEMVAVVIAVQVCELGHVALARWLVVGVTAAAIAVSVSGAFVAMESWRRLAGRSPATPEPSGTSLADTDARGRQTLMAVAGIGLGITLTLGLVWGGLPALVVSDICGLKR